MFINDKIAMTKEMCEALYEELKIANNHWDFHVPVTLLSDKEFQSFLVVNNEKEVLLLLQNELEILERSMAELSNDYEDEGELLHYGIEDVPEMVKLKASGGLDT